MNVALYLRRSTNERLQADSLTVQEEVLRKYAQDHGMEVLDVFMDSASGTSTKHRTEFLRMVEAITHGAAFSAVLVRDVSRFGRFYDVDEGAFFEVLFLGHGVKTVYCEEVFGSDTSPMASLVKSIRRVMASEYSRDRSRLVRYAQSRAARLGFHPGGPPPYGLRRVMVTSSGQHVQDLAPGEWKALSSHRTRLVPGELDAVSTVRRIFDLYDREEQSVTAIAAILNDAKVPAPHGSRWYEPTVAGVLSNSKYAGLGHYRPRRKGLSDPLQVAQVEDLAVRDAAGHEAIVDLEQFRRVEARMNRFTSRRSNETLAADARKGLELHGCVEPAMFDHLPIRCSWETYRRRFPRGIDEALEKAFAAEIADGAAAVIDLLRAEAEVQPRDDVWIVEETLRVHIQVAFPHRRRTGIFWQFRAPAIRCDVILSFGIDASGRLTDDLFLFRGHQLAHHPRGMFLRCDGGGGDAWRFRVPLTDIARRVALLRYAGGEGAEERLLTAARSKALVNFSELARELAWPHHAVRKMYWRLVARGVWFPPLKYRAGRLLEIVCKACGKTRWERPNRAVVLRSDTCFICTATRPKKLVRIHCPVCGRVAERWPSAVKKLSGGTDTVCKLCRARAGLRR